MANNNQIPQPRTPLCLQIAYEEELLANLTQELVDQHAGNPEMIQSLVERATKALQNSFDRHLTYLRVNESYLLEPTWNSQVEDPFTWIYGIQELIHGVNGNNLQNISKEQLESLGVALRRTRQVEDTLRSTLSELQEKGCHLIETGSGRFLLINILGLSLTRFMEQVTSLRMEVVNDINQILNPHQVIEALIALVTLEVAWLRQRRSNIWAEGNPYQ